MYIPQHTLTQNRLHTAVRRSLAKIGQVFFIVVFLSSAVGVSPISAQTGSQAPSEARSPNPIVAENALQGNDPSEWDITGAGDTSIQGFATDISVNHGGTIGFKVDTDAAAYHLDIYRVGYYGGKGARKVAAVQPSATLPQSQPDCLFEPSNGNLVDCGNWAVSASWYVPATAVSGVYIAHLVRDDVQSQGSQILFIVRDDGNTSDLFFQTSDSTWQAYNGYGDYSLYANSQHAHKVSYNRPFTTRATPQEDNFFNAEYPMIRWLERNGYDVSYTTDMDTDRRGSELLLHKTFLSVGHDEYWSAAQRTAVTAARDAGVNLAFFSGNEIYWKTRWEPSTDGSNTPNRTLVSYKEGQESLAPGEHYDCINIDNCDPLTAGASPVWTGLWRDGCSLTNGDACLPENSLSGNISWDGNTSAIMVPAEDGKMRFWRNTSIASLNAGTSATLPAGTLGYEWDWQQYEQYYPANRIVLSTTDYDGKTHHLSLYKAQSRALVFSAGTVQWSWGLDSTHDRPGTATDINMQQATVNLLADLGAQPATLQSGLVSAAASADTAAPTTAITSPTGGTVNGGVTITGTAADTGGNVAAVQVSTDGGNTWAQASGRENWTYDWHPTITGSASIVARAVDDSANMGANSAAVNVTVQARTCPCSLWDPGNTGGPQESDTNATELGVKFQSSVSGYITAIRFYKTAANTGTHIGNLWDASGNNLGTVTFSPSDETASGWQQAAFSAPIPISANTTYIASYLAPSGHYAQSTGYFSSALSYPPLSAPQDTTGSPNGLYRYGAGGGFPNLGYQASNYWVDVVFETSVAPTAPVVSSTSPLNGATTVPLNSVITATFNQPMNDTTINATTFTVSSAGGPVTGTVGYNSTLRKATFTPTDALTTSTVYTATIKGGAGGVSNAAVPPLTMAVDKVWTFTAAPPAPLPPTEGPGGPILIVTNANYGSNLFGRYYAEILRGEGFNAFLVTDMSNVTAQLLTSYDVVLLAETSLTPAQISLFDSWVYSGGSLIAFRPAKGLATLYGLTDASGTTSEGYVGINTSTSIGKGVTSTTMQFHGTADNYTLSGATSLATLYTTASASTAYPAIVRSTRGSGQVVMFTYDLAKSVVLTRQGNPAWAGTEGDGATDAIRATDMFFHTGQTSWIDTSRIAIPQADEQMHVLSHAIEQLAAYKLPFPRLWYFANKGAGALIMTGDSEGCSTACVSIPMDDVNARGGHYTVYLEGNGPSSTDVAGWRAAGNGVGAHYNDTANATNPTLANMMTVYDTETPAFGQAYGFTPVTVRNHWVLWAGWADQAKVEVQHGLQLDTNYYNWGSWVSGAGPGYFTGSGLPMRFSDETGQILDIFQSTTQLPDEGWTSNVYNAFKTLIDWSVDQGYYGFLNANFHPPSYASYQAQADSMMTYATSKGVPIWSAEQLNDFLRARNQARTENMTWDGLRLHFDFTALTPYTGLTLTIPATANGHNLLSLKVGSTDVNYTVVTVKGYSYAMFVASNGSYTASYEPDTVPPTIAARAPVVNATNVAVNSNVVVTFSEPIDPATINSATFRLRAAGAGTDVSAALSYNESTMAVTLNPAADLDYETGYTVTVSQGVRDVSGNDLVADATWSFTTQAAPPPSVGDTSSADFSAGSVGSCKVDDAVGDGALRLSAAIDESFSGTTLPGGWSTHSWAAGSSAAVAGGSLTVDGAYARNDTLFNAGHTLDFVATFGAQPYQHVGFGADDSDGLTFNSGPWAMFSTGTDGTKLYTRVNTAASSDVALALVGTYLGSPHAYRIVWNTDSIDFYIDNARVDTRSIAISAPMRVAVSDLNAGDPKLSVDSLLMLPPYNTPCTFLSRVLDGGGNVNWASMSWTSMLPTGTGIAMSYRTGNTPTPVDGTWSSFAAVSSSPTVLNVASRYIQYQAALSASDTNQSPVLQDVTITHSGLVPDITAPIIAGRSPAADATNVAVATNVTVSFNESMNATLLTSGGVRLRAHSAGTDVTATITYDVGSMTATLDPDASLAYSTLYDVTVLGSVTDLAGNQLGADVTWSFTTTAAPLPTFVDTTAADFSAGTLDSCVLDSPSGDAAVQIGSPLNVDFTTGPNLPAGWASYDWTYDSTAGVYGFSSGFLTLDGVRVDPDPAAYSAPQSLEFRATFSAVAANQHIGFGSGSHTPPNSIFDNDPPYWAIFSTMTGGGLYARTWYNTTHTDSVNLGSAYLGSPHTYRIDWTATQVTYYIDGSQVAQQAYSGAGITMRPAISDLTQDGNLLQVDWMRLLSHASSCTFTSRVFDAGGSANWSSLSWTAASPAGTAVAMSYRTGDTPVPDASWTAPTSVPTSGSPLSGSSRYIQYQSVLSTTDTTQTPGLQDVTITHTTAIPDTTAPTITGRSPTSGATGVASSTNVVVIFDEPMDPTTITASSFRLRAEGAGSDVAANVTYDAASRTATLGPTSDLSYLTPYHFTVASSATDLAGNPLETDSSWIFTTIQAPLPTLADSATADFAAGTVDSCYVDSTIGDGAVRLPLTLDEPFSGSSVPAAWTTNIWTGSIAPSVSGGLLTVNGSQAYTTATYTMGHTLELVATFNAHAYESVGFAGGNPPLNLAPWAQFSTGSDGAQLYARILPTGGVIGSSEDKIALGASYLGSPHTYRIDWKPTGVEWFIDGVSVVTRTTVLNETMHVTASDYTSDANTVTVDWVKLTPYASPCTFTSRVFDATQAVNWDTLTYTGDTPTGASLGLSYRIGSTSDLSSVQWVALSGASPLQLAGNSRYIQYQAALSTSDPTVTPVLRDASFAFHTGADTTPPVIAGVAAAPTASSAVIGWNTNEPADSLVEYGTSPASLTQSQSLAILQTSHSISLSGLSEGTTYYYRVTSKDATGNSTTSPAPGNSPSSFTTGLTPHTLTDTTAADFSAGSSACRIDPYIGDGALTLRYGFEENFSGTSLPAGWSSGLWTPPDGSVVFDGSTATIDGGRLATGVTFSPGSSLIFRAKFTSATFQYIGFATTPAVGSPWVNVGEGNSAGSVYARRDDANDVLLSSTALNSYHTYRVDWNANNFVFSVDGGAPYTMTRTLAGPLYVIFSDFAAGGGALSVDSVEVKPPYVTPCVFTSRVFDAGQPVHWSTLSMVGTTNSAATVSFETRTSDSDGYWEPWQPVTASIASVDGQFIQYRATLNTTNTSQSPTIESVTLTYTNNVHSPLISGNAGADGVTLSYDDGGSKTSATAGDGSFSFTVSYNWSGTITPSKAGYTFLPVSKSYTHVKADLMGEDYTATINHYALTVSKSGTGLGTVTSVPAGIDCGATCSVNYDHGTPVTLTAAATPGSTFSGWSGACSGSGACVVTMDGAKSVTATFTLNQYTLTILKDGSGYGAVSSDPAGIDCGTTCSASYDYDTLVTLTAVADNGSTFKGWSITRCGAASTCAVTMASARSVTAVFDMPITLLAPLGDATSWDHAFRWTGLTKATRYLLDVQKPDGTVVWRTWYTSAQASCSGSTSCWVAPAGLAELSGSYKWGIQDYGPYGYGPLTGYADFTVPAAPLACYTLTAGVLPVEGGTITPPSFNCSGGYTAGTVVPLSVVPNVGWVLGNWSGAASGSSNPISVTMNGNKSVTANMNSVVALSAPLGDATGWDHAFRWTGIPTASRYLLAVKKADDNVVVWQTWYTSAQASCSGSTSCWVAPAGLAELSGSYKWGIQDYGPYGYGPLTGYADFTVPAACYTLTASVLPVEGGTITPPAFNCSGGYTAGTVVPLSVVPNVGWVLGNWSGAASGSSNPISVTMNGNKSVTANMNSVVALSAPLGDATGWDHAFRWTGIATASRYLLAVKKADDNVVVWQTWYTSAQAGCFGSTSCSIAPAELANLAGGSYKWGIQDYGPYGYGPLTGYADFTVPAAPLACYTLTAGVLPAEGGTITPPAFNCSGGYTAGTVVPLSVVPNVGWVLGNWSGAASGSSNPISVTMNGNKSVTANMNSVVALSAPLGDATGWDHAFRWTGIPTASRYLLAVKKADDNVVVWQTWYTSAQAGCSGSTSCSIAPAELANLAGGSYKWGIQDYGPYGYGPLTGYADFTVPAACYTLTASVLPVEGGTITPPAFNCSGGYTAGTVVPLSVVPNVGWVLGNWSGAASGSSNPISVTMNGNKSVTANMNSVVALSAPLGDATGWDHAFRWTGIPTASRYLLAVKKADDNVVVWQTWYTSAQASCSGSTSCWVAPAGLAELSGSYKWGIQDYGPYGYGPLTGYADFTVPAACYTLTASVLPVEGGTITPPAFNCSGGYTAGTVVPLSVVPNVGWVLGNWSGAASGSSNPISVTMNGNKSVTANMNSVVALSAPLGDATGWDHAFRWTGIATASRYLLAVKKADDNVVVWQTWYTSAQAGCFGSTSCSIAPAELANLAGGSYKWSIQDYGPYGYGPLTGYADFTVPAAPLACYTLTASVLPVEGGTITPPAFNCSGGYTAGTVVPLSVVPNVGWVLGNWSGAASGSSNPISVTMNGNKSVTANMNSVVALSAPLGDATGWDHAFRWMGIATASRYLLDVQKPDGTVVWRTWYTSAQASCSGSTSCSVTPAGLAELSGSYKWGIQDYGPYGYGPLTGYADFTIP